VEVCSGLSSDTSSGGPTYGLDLSQQPKTKLADEGEGGDGTRLTEGRTMNMNGTDSKAEDSSRRVGHDSEDEC
jgi:hypothetical protein